MAVFGRRRESGSCVFVFKQSVESRFLYLKHTQNVFAERRPHFLCKRVFRNCSLFQVGSSLQVRRQTGEGAFLIKLLQTDTHADKK